MTNTYTRVTELTHKKGRVSLLLKLITELGMGEAGATLELLSKVTHTATQPNSKRSVYYESYNRADPPPDNPNAVILDKTRSYLEIPFSGSTTTESLPKIVIRTQDTKAGMHASIYEQKEGSGEQKEVSWEQKEVSGRNNCCVYFAIAYAMGHTPTPNNEDTIEFSQEQLKKIYEPLFLATPEKELSTYLNQQLTYHSNTSPEIIEKICSTDERPAPGSAADEPGGSAPEGSTVNAVLTTLKEVNNGNDIQDHKEIDAIIENLIAKEKMETLDTLLQQMSTYFDDQSQSPQGPKRDHSPFLDAFLNEQKKELDHWNKKSPDQANIA